MAPSNGVSYIHPMYKLFFQKIEPAITLWTGYVNLRNRTLSGSLLISKISIEDYYLFRDQFVLEQAVAQMSTRTFGVELGVLEGDF
ncbi:hypothetical protein TGAM01_v208626 [Trichoderma gamsii]|uniref:Uncharacterized protein n=1 Tax=Trichoderma gamsii TaxID=398673 RepID=A0A2P4ZE22_9HYPO|nr:hypothetical protein TGAM01_v208626 [Trichoderma gamsii]PON22542.1 hypothetical protein TGAM01_v208626 [Trichoderma gamsii]